MSIKNIIKFHNPLKTITLIITLVAALAFIACGSNNATPAESLTRQDFLEDLDYLLKVTEQNFPYLGIAYRRFGVHLLDAGQALREKIADENTPIDFTTFINLLRSEFFANRSGIGHFWMLSEAERLRNYERWAGGYMFFGAEHSNFMHSIMGTPPRYPSPIPNHPGAAPNPSGDYAVVFEIIEEGRIAYMRLASLHDELLYRDDDILNFLMGLGGFEHLIIDMRSSLGGRTEHFDNLVAARLINQRLSVTYHDFYKAGPHNIAFLGLFGRMPNAGPFAHRRFDIGQLDTIFANVGGANYICPDVLADLSVFDYHFSGTRTVVPGPVRSPFNGKIWMLVDERVMSAGTQVAHFYKETGFATLVGQTTGGGVGGNSQAQAGAFHIRNYFALPNTNMIVMFDLTFRTDSQGRPLELGVEPHYFNRPGMDALETVLVIIGEGGY